LPGGVKMKIFCGSVIRRLGVLDDPGTAGCLVRFPDDPEKLFWLTAGHVLVGRAAKQFDPVETKDLPGQTVGVLFGWTRPGLGEEITVDAALVHVNPKLVSPQIGPLGVPKGTNLDPKPGDRLTIFAMGAQRSGTIQQCEVDKLVNIVGPDFDQQVTYRKQILCSNFSTNGCSGAIAIDDSGNVVGMVVAGDGATFTLITPIAAVLGHPDWGEGDPLEIATAVLPTAQGPSLTPPMPPPPVVRRSFDITNTPPPRPDSALEAALRTALRLFEIGDANPYRLSFAAKGKSGATFGFMQGDMAAAQPLVQDIFRRALDAAGIAAAEITALAKTLSVHLIQNPLSPVDTQRINAALDAPPGRALVDQMDTAIFAEVRGQLDRCAAAGVDSGRTIAPKAQIYMALWINMSGPPTVLLTWLSGQDVSMAQVVPKPGQLVDAAAMEDYLRATDFFAENPGNLPHLLQCATAGAALLGPAAPLGLAAAPVRVVRLAADPGVNINATPAIQQLVAIASEASRTLPDGYRVIVTSTLRPGAIVADSGGPSQHAAGNAIDIAIVDPNGARIPNKGSDDTGLYRQLAIAAFNANQRLFPNRSGQLAWGGNFTTGPVAGPRDLMHFDYGGDRGRFGSLAREASGIA
jgi:hypothetical protein